GSSSTTNPPTRKTPGRRQTVSLAGHRRLAFRGAEWATDGAHAVGRGLFVSASASCPGSSGGGRSPMSGLAHQQARTPRATRLGAADGEARAIQVAILEGHASALGAKNERVIRSDGSGREVS